MSVGYFENGGSPYLDQTPKHSCTIPLYELQDEMKTLMHLIKQTFEEAIGQPLNYWNSQFGQSFAV